MSESLQDLEYLTEHLKSVCENARLDALLKYEVETWASQIW